MAKELEGIDSANGVATVNIALEFAVGEGTDADVCAGLNLSDGQAGVVAQHLVADP